MQWTSVFFIAKDHNLMNEFNSFSTDQVLGGGGGPQLPRHLWHRRQRLLLRSAIQVSKGICNGGAAHGVEIYPISKTTL